MHASVKAKLANFLKEYEGKFGYMYLDVKALVTVGIGNKIDPVDQALKLNDRAGLCSCPGRRASAGVCA
jgi:hypothetical protein